MRNEFSWEKGLPRRHAVQKIALESVHIPELKGEVRLAPEET